MSDIAIRVENLGKLYRIGQRERYYTLRDVLARSLTVPWRHLRRILQFAICNPKSGNSQFAIRSSQSDSYIWALKDVSFEVKKGEVLGVIGQNGAGKSTLLKILSRISEPTEGYAEIHGRVGSLLEVGTGFHPELTGRENVYLNGAILGMKKREIDSKFDEIVAFAEVEKFIDTPLKHYSSGMYVRLAFAVAAHLEPEILLLDEVLAVGDIAFQKKCLGKMGEVAKEGHLILFVSHNMQAIGSLCTLCIRLDNGRIADSGRAVSVVAGYLRSLQLASDDDVISEDKRYHPYIDTSGIIRFTSISFMNSKGEKTKVLFFKEPFTVRIAFEVLQPIKEMRLALGISTPDGMRISTTHHTDRGLETVNLTEGHYSITVYLQNHLTPGSYVICLGAHELRTRHGLDFIPNIVTFTVMDFSEDRMDLHDPYNIGPANLSAEWTDISHHIP